MYATVNQALAVISTRTITSTSLFQGDLQSPRVILSHIGAQYMACNNISRSAPTLLLLLNPGQRALSQGANHWDAAMAEGCVTLTLTWTHRTSGNKTCQKHRGRTSLGCSDAGRP
jgi:hypothetical protein